MLSSKPCFSYLSFMILVTGGTGLVGSHLLWELTTHGHSVRATYRSDASLQKTKALFSYKQKKQDNALNNQDLYKEIQWFKADITDIPTLEQAFLGITQVYHCAALVSFDPARLKEMQKVNMEGTANLVNLSLQYKVDKFCHVSSVATLGMIKTERALTEEDHWTPHKNNTVYSITKFASEAEVWRGTQEGLPAVIVNPAIILGEGPYQEGSGRFFKHVYKKNRFTAPGGNDFVDVQDVVNIMIKLMESPVQNERFIIAAEHWAYKQFFEQIAKNFEVSPPSIVIKRWQLQTLRVLDYLANLLTGKPRKVLRNTLDAAFRHRHFDASKIKKTLNYTFLPIKESIKRVAAHYKEHQP